MARFLTGLLLVLLLAGKAAALKDPTRPIDPALYFGSGNIGGWALQSILFSNNRRIAIINGTRVQEGDRIGSARVIHIQDSLVVLETGNRTLKLRLRPHTLKTRP
jgi:MSHA biogenesis protein MshK